MKKIPLSSKEIFTKEQSLEPCYSQEMRENFNSRNGSGSKRVGSFKSKLAHKELELHS